MLSFNKKVIVPVAVFSAIATALLVYGRAAVPSVAVEAESGRLSTGASIVADATASGGAMINFSAPEPVKKIKIIKASHVNPSSQYFADNIEAIKRLPIDGVILTMPAVVASATRMSFAVQTTLPLSYEQFKTELEPFARADKGRLTDNFVIVHARAGNGFFADYSVQTSNFKNLARAAKEAGFKGIVYDPEAYREKFWDWPQHCPEYTLIECQDQARLRGKQVMEAMIQEWPSMVLLSYIGPGVSDPKTVYEYNSLKPEPIYWDGSTVYEMKGAFVVGMVEATVGTGAKVVDGSEIYTLRSPQEHSVVYNWNKRGMAERGTIIPPSIRSVYANSISVSFGIYDSPYAGAPMDPTIWKNVIKIGADYADHYLWLYTDRYDWFGNHPDLPPVTDEWLNATREARDSIPNL